jgi:tight adherence protein B
MKRLGFLGVVLLALLALPCGSALAAGVELSEAQGAKFPDKAFVLTLPQQRVLTSTDVVLTENGQQVPGVKVVPGSAAGARSFGVVLVIDTSQSMRGAPIAAAMNAARQFASHRPPSQQLGIVFFSHDHSVALPLTTDSAKINAALAAEPALSKGTRLYDATSAGMSLLSAGKIHAGSVVVLSDGADVGSTLSNGVVSDAARRTHVRIFTVGLRSRSYNSSTLKELAATSAGRYAEAAPGQLAALFTALGKRFGREYLVTYRSTSPAGSRVNVAASVAGTPGAGTVSYTTPSLPSAHVSAPAKAGFWSSTKSLVIGALIAAALIAFCIYLMLKPSRRSVRDRISSFVTEDFGLQAHSPEEVELMSALSARKGSDRLAQSRSWQNFAENVDVAHLDIQPRRLALFTIAATIVAVLLAGAVLGNAFLGILALTIPLFVVAGVRAKADRERRAFEQQLPDNLQVIASAMRAGQSFTGALAVAVEDAAQPARRELNRCVTDERLGMPVDEALGRAAVRMQSEELEYVGLVARLQRDTGGNTAEVIDRVTETIRERAELKREVRTLTAQGRLAGLIVSGLPIFLVIVLGSLSKGYFQPLVNTSTGRLLIAVGVLLLLTGWLAIRRIVEIKI